MPEIIPPPTPIKAGSFTDPKAQEQFFWYIKQAHKQQIPDEEIKKRFIALGWPEKFVNESLKRASVLKRDVMISINGLTRIFTDEGYEQIVLNDVYLDINQGDFVSISGKSGAGKTSLLYIVGLLDEPTKGKVIIDRENIFSYSEKERVNFRLKTIGYIFQFFNLINNYNVTENIAFQMRLQGYSKKKATVRAKEIIDFLNLGEKALSFPGKLSGGMQQKVAIGRALAKDSKIILADEPTAHLDSKGGEEIISLLKDINRKFGKTIVLVTHEDDYAKAAETQVLMADGRIVSVLS